MSHWISTLFLIALCVTGFCIVNSSSYEAHAEQTSNSNATISITKDFIDINSITEGTVQTLHLPRASLMFDIVGHTDQENRLYMSVQSKPELQNLYKDLGFPKGSHDTVFIYPSFTQAAYEKGGFYDFYHKICDSNCLTVPIPTHVNGFQSSSIFGAWVLKLLNYTYVKDEDVDKNPDILKQYKRVIVLHNEYVTKKEFDAITNHPDVVFLYPNALYAQVEANYNYNTITLIRGHGYPDIQIKNGFDWKYDNSKYEYDVNCDDWNFYKLGNYSMLNCYPEYRIIYAEQLLRLLKSADPSDLLSDMTNWLRYKDDSSTKTLLSDFDIEGKHLPRWVVNPALWTQSNDISRTEFAHLIQYLSDQKLLN